MSLNDGFEEDEDTDITQKKLMHVIRNLFTGNPAIQRRHLPPQSSSTRHTLTGTSLNPHSSRHFLFYSLLAEKLPPGLHVLHKLFLSSGL